MPTGRIYAFIGPDALHEIFRLKCAAIAGVTLTGLRSHQQFQSGAQSHGHAGPIT